MKYPNSVCVIISTYNSPEWLKKTLFAYSCQTRLPDEIIIADDGSTEETKTVVDTFKEMAPFPVKYVWHEDDGFRKCVILNKAINKIESEYVIFVDQDCVPREDFVETHCSFAQQGRFLSGGVVMLDMELSGLVSEENIKSKEIFDINFLKKQGHKANFKSSKLTRCKSFASFMNFITPANASWNGGNASGWVSDILAVNGYNNKMVYGGEDREMGERLENMGLKGKQIRYSAICVHLDHNRPYKNEELIKKNIEIRKNTRKNRIVRTPDGVAEVL